MLVDRERGTQVTDGSRSDADRSMFGLQVAVAAVAVIAALMLASLR